MPVAKLTCTTYIKDSAGRIVQTKVATDEPTVVSNGLYKDLPISSTAISLGTTQLGTGTSFRLFVCNTGLVNILVNWYKDGGTTKYTNTLKPGKFLYLPGLELNTSYLPSIECAAGSTSTANACLLGI